MEPVTAVTSPSQNQANKGQRGTRLETFDESVSAENTADLYKTNSESDYCTGISVA
eukprot:COSAG06_NODE_542_length_14469_cov_39.223591_11_plen_56_part_00